jgi:hypothetical protein
VDTYPPPTAHTHASTHISTQALTQQRRRTLRLWLRPRIGGTGCSGSLPEPRPPPPGNPGPLPAVAWLLCGSASPAPPAAASAVAGRHWHRHPWRCWTVAPHCGTDGRGLGCRGGSSPCPAWSCGVGRPRPHQPLVWRGCCHPWPRWLPGPGVQPTQCPCTEPGGATRGRGLLHCAGPDPGPHPRPRLRHDESAAAPLTSPCSRRQRLGWAPHALGFLDHPTPQRTKTLIAVVRGCCGDGCTWGTHVLASRGVRLE